MSKTWSAYLLDSLVRLDNAKLRRQRRVFDSAGILDFGSNDYLGLRAHPQVLAALQSASRAAWGSGASPVLSGYTAEHAALERALADFAAAPDALLFSSGYACNVGTVACLAGQGDLLLSDQLNHASLIDGCRLSRAHTQVFPHGDVDFLRRLLRAQRTRYDKVLLLSESIFSMDGDAAPLIDLVALAEQYDCGLVVDEAHAVGVYGSSGGGLLEELGLHHRVLAKLGTLSKALGCVGGYACGSSPLIEYLVSHCRSYLFSTASPGASLAAAHAALRLLRQRGDARQGLRQSARALRSQLAALGLDVPPGDSPILPVILGSEERVLTISQQLAERAIYVPAIRPPTVPRGTARLRISLSTRHTGEQIEQLLTALRQAL